ncbi:MAG TPA: 3-phosphoshikimate 1-carboxyvinyltransferase [Oligoflexia bacterium]|nr:3-phosphoshikimate 1-carboxyvinyltransferase [Oligoflexia bacterium]HMP47151.1 3-phosphoshikimate 1-carboxyvinyltransferase [Oligoflexia bacterium]
MTSYSIPYNSSLAGEIRVPGDKSITHRGVLFSVLAKGDSFIRTNAIGRDNFASIRIMQQLGAEIALKLTKEMFRIAISEDVINITEVSGDECIILVSGNGIRGLRESTETLYCGNSGTTARLLCGILSATDFKSHLAGDESLGGRPFDRVIEPLSKMGAAFSSNKLPFTVYGAFAKKSQGGILNGQFHLKKASAQVKSAILLAGLFSDGETIVTEPVMSRDHTERMLIAMNAPIHQSFEADGRYKVLISGLSDSDLLPLDIQVPGDISAAMFFLVAGLVSNGSGLVVRGVGINPSRSACLDVLRKMNGRLEMFNDRLVGGEPVADIRVYPSKLKGVSLDGNEVARLIDEVPILSVAAAFAKGVTVFSGAEELRVKESDRISMTVAMLKYFGLENIEEYPDGMKIEGQSFKPTENLKSNLSEWMNSGDHRILMSAAILEYLLSGSCTIHDYSAIETSFPGFIYGFSDHISS